jgi:hypothetical protein
MKTLVLILFFAAIRPAHACDFCMLGQGVSPYLTPNGKGLTLDVNSTESDKVYQSATVLSSGIKTEGWLIYSLTGFYALSEKLTLLLTLPYTFKTNVDYDASTNTTPGEQTSGLGDATLSARYTFFSDHTLTSTLLLGGLAGLKFPTGSTDVRDSFGNPVDRHALPGTGSFDPVLGLTGVYTFGGDWQITADAIYSISTPGKWAGDDHRYGNAFNYSLDGLGEKSLFLLAGLSGENTGKETGYRSDSGYSAAAINGSSGGTVIYADLGFHASVSADTIINGKFSKAIYHDMNFDPNFDPDPAENYKLDFSVTYLF